MHLNLALKSWWLKLHFDLGLGNTYDMEKSERLSLAESKSNSLGLDFGYVFPTKSKLKLGVFTGVGLTTSNLDLSYDNSDYAYNTSEDVDGDKYERHYKNLSLKQKVKLSEFNVPLYADIVYHFNQYIGFYADLGIRLNFDMGHKIDATEGRAEIYGVYKEYGDIVLDDNWPYNGFGQHQYSNNELINSEVVDINSFTVDALGGLGFRLNIPKAPVSIDLGVNYLMGLNELVKTGVTIDSNTDTRLVYNEVSGLNSVEKVRNLTEMLNSIKRKQFSASLGVIVKF